MVKVALWVRLEAKPGKEAEVEAFLRSGLPLVEAEPATTVWFGLRIGPSTFGIFERVRRRSREERASLGSCGGCARPEGGEYAGGTPPVIERVNVPSAAALQMDREQSRLTKSDCLSSST